MSDPTPKVTPDLIRAYARWTGVALSLERAAGLGDLLAPLLRADQHLANLNLIDPVGPLWPEEHREE